MSDETREPNVPDESHESDVTSSRLSRRRALKVLGALPLAAAVADAQQAQPPSAPDHKARQGHERPTQPAATEPQPPKNAPTKKFFTAKEMRTLRVLADDVIPKDERSGSATDAGVPEFIDFNLGVPETDDATRVAWRGGLRWMDTESKKRFGVAYASATPTQRHAILDDIAGPMGPPTGTQPTDWMRTMDPSLRPGAAFFARARDMIGGGFFSSAMGWKDLQYIGNTFNPNWNGCPQPALDKLGVSYEVMKTRVPVGR